MFTIKSLHVSFEIWGCIFCLIAALCIYFSTIKGAKGRLLLAMQLSTAMLLLMDAFAWGCRGSATQMGYYMVRISNFSVFFISVALMMLFHAYVCCHIFGGGEGRSLEVSGNAQALGNSPNLEVPGNPDSPQTPGTPAPPMPLRARLAYAIGASGAGEAHGTPAPPMPLRARLVYAIGAAGMALVVLSQFTNLYYYFDADNFYHRSPMYPLSLLVCLSGVAIDLSLLIQYRSRLRKPVFISMISYAVLPVLAGVILMFFYGISLVNIAIGISMIFLFIVTMAEQGRMLSEKERELAESRTRILMSQIQPHFIFNSLNAIKELCKKNPPEAVEALSHFSGYLRAGIDLLTEEKYILLERELENVKNYLYLEQKRFGDRLKVVYDIREKGFLVPSLSIQPMVENAVRHGICRRLEGGCVTITTGADSQSWLIEIIDDGVGFEEKPPAASPDDTEKTHIGIANVRNRLEAMCGGSLEITGIPEKGTRVTIRIPKSKTITNITKETLK